MAMSSLFQDSLVPRRDALAETNRGRTLVVVSWFLICVSIAIVGARCWSKFKHARQLYYDDAVMLFAVVSSAIQTCDMFD